MAYPRRPNYTNGPPYSAWKRTQIMEMGRGRAVYQAYPAVDRTNQSPVNRLQPMDMISESSTEVDEDDYDCDCESEVSTVPRNGIGSGNSSFSVTWSKNNSPGKNLSFNYTTNKPELKSMDVSSNYPARGYMQTQYTTIEVRNIKAPTNNDPFVTKPAATSRHSSQQPAVPPLARVERPQNAAIEPRGAKRLTSKDQVQDRSPTSTVRAPLQKPAVPQLPTTPRSHNMAIKGQTIKNTMDKNTFQDTRPMTSHQSSQQPVVQSTLQQTKENTITDVEPSKNPIDEVQSLPGIPAAPPSSPQVATRSELSNAPQPEIIALAVQATNGATDKDLLQSKPPTTSPKSPMQATSLQRSTSQPPAKATKEVASNFSTVPQAVQSEPMTTDVACNCSDLEIFKKKPKSESHKASNTEKDPYMCNVCPCCGTYLAKKSSHTSTAKQSKCFTQPCPSTYNTQGQNSNMNNEPTCPNPYVPPAQFTSGCTLPYIHASNVLIPYPVPCMRSPCMSRHNYFCNYRMHGPWS